MTLTNGLGGAKDWLGFAAVGTTDGPGKYLQWIYVGAGVTTRTWTVTAPTTPGQYEFRFFPNDTYTRLATSPAVTVLGPTLTVTATTAPPGGQVTVTLTNSPGGAQDWLALATVGGAVDQLPPVGLRGGRGHDADVDGHDADDAGAVPVPPLPEQRLHAGGNEPAGDRGALRVDPAPRGAGECRG